MDVLKKVIATYVNKTVIIASAIMFVLGLFLGYYLFHNNVEQVAQTNTEMNGEVKTQIKYMEKENPQDADVSIHNPNPVVEVNGKKYELEKLPNEEFKFEAGKIDVTQGYRLDINYKEDIPTWGIDVGYTNHGIKLGYERHFNKHITGYIEGTVKPIEGKDRYYGIGVTGSF